MESKIALRIDKFIFFSLKNIIWNRKSDKREKNVSFPIFQDLNKA